MSKPKKIRSSRSYASSMSKHICVAFSLMLSVLIAGVGGCQRKVTDTRPSRSSRGVSESQISQVLIGMTVADVFSVVKKTLFEGTIVRYPKSDGEGYYFVVFSPTVETSETDREFDFTVEAIVEGESFLGGEYRIPKQLKGTRCTGLWGGVGSKNSDQIKESNENKVSGFNNE